MKFEHRKIRNDKDVHHDIELLYSMWKSGLLGGESMPEDVHPDLPRDSAELMHYLTLGMCLNYQRNSYKLWESCTSAYENEEDRWVFSPEKVASTEIDILREVLVRNRIALQPNKHVQNWARVANGIVRFGRGDVRVILENNEFDIAKIREFIQSNKKGFPYLAGNKICNYWLYVLWQYSTLPISNREALTVAPDTHVLNASVQLGLLREEDIDGSVGQEKCVRAWERVLKDSKLMPIDIHTPFWLWSRMKFPVIVNTTSN